MTSESSRSGSDSLSESLGFPETRIELGMTHPGVRHAMTAVGGTAGFLVRLDDDRITDLEVEIGLGHRGFEKQVESTSYAGALPYMSRLGHSGGVIAETAYCLAVEMLGDITIPDRAIWLRMLVGEAARISDHFARLAAVMSAIGLHEAGRVAEQGEVESARLLSAATGRGPLEGWSRIGGVASSLPPDFSERWSASRAQLEQRLASFSTIGVSNPTCQRRLRDVVPMSADDALAWGMSGPPLRATGQPSDVRRDAPYLAYAALDFDVPVGETGDDFDRLLVVVEEVRQSLEMIEQCHKLLASLGPGAILADGFDSAIGVDPIQLPAGEAVATVESSTGELAFWLVADGTSCPLRVRCRAPSFFHAQAMQSLMIGARLDDLMPTAALLHLVSGECDR